MKVAYCSLLLPEEKKLSERTKERLPGVSLHKLANAIIEGLDYNFGQPMTIFNIINTLNYPKFPDLIFKTEQWSHVDDSLDWHIGYINLLGIKYITQFNNLYRKLDKWVKNNGKEKSIIFVHHIYYPAMEAAYKIRCKYGSRVVICLITGDMNGSYGLPSQEKVNLKDRLLHYIENRIDKIAKFFDCFVFATKDMAKGFGVEDKPFTVLECTYTDPVYASDTFDECGDERIIFYAGSLRKEYGIEHLLKSFSMIKDDKYRLWLAGGGSAVPLIKEYALNDPRIIFLGFLPPQEVDRRQQLSTALISPRTSEHNYVRFSFPSKTMECLASGKPYIAHKLPCDPIEYGKHIQYAENESDQALCDKIIEICELSQEERDFIGKKAQRFIIDEKNPKVMCKRIVDMLDKM